MENQDTSALSQGNSQEYTKAVLAFLGDRSPLEVFETIPAEIEAATRGLTDEQLRTPEKPGKWSVLEVVWHLADVEPVLGFRYRKVLAESGCTVPPIDQDAWARELRYNARELTDAFEQYQAARKFNLDLLRNTPDEHFERYAIHEERGKETLRLMTRLYAAHDRYHLHQIERIKRAIGAA